MKVDTTPVVKYKGKTYGGEKLPCELYVDGYMYPQIKYMYGRNVRNYDTVGFVCGGEGNGKSVFAAQTALLLDPKFNLDKVVFTEEAFIEAVDNADKFSAIVWDEADAIADHHASTVVRVLTSKLKRIRDHKLFIIIVTPTIWDMNKYFGAHRIMWTAHIYNVSLERGFFRYFNQQKTKQLYLKGKKTWDWKCETPNFRGRFLDVPDDFPFSMGEGSEYQDKKHEATRRIGNEAALTPKQRLLKLRRDSLVRFYRWHNQKYGKDPTQSDAAFIFDVDQSTISADLKEVNYGL